MMFSASLRLAPAALGAMLCAALAACTVGPDYHGAPAAPDAAAQAPGFARTPGASAGVSADPAQSQWWLALNEPQLNRLIDAALAHNANLQAAQARLREARSQLAQQRANELPKVSGSVAALRMREPDLSSLLGSSAATGGASGQQSAATESLASASGGGPLQLYTAGFDASWEIDLFGGTRRAIEAASEQAQAVEADLADTQVSLAAEVAQAYIDLRDQQTRLALSQQTAALQQQALSLTEQRRARGVSGDSDVENLSSQLQNTRATVAPLDAGASEALDRLAVLTGRAPGALDAELSAAAPLPALPSEVPVGDPAALLKRRPDIRAAERRLASSNAQIGEHIADFFPKVSLVGTLGYSAGDPGHLLRKENFSWMGVPYLQWNLFDFGRTLGAVRAAQASRDEAEAQYTQTVLEALQDANTSLSRYGHQRENLAALEQVAVSAQRTSDLMQQRYAAGVASRIDLLNAQRSALDARQNAIAARADLLKDYVSLQKSLGLGWQAPAA
jgi:outer membrane protein, multidrug efflux system